jgi:hypothetical protein
VGTISVGALCVGIAVSACIVFATAVPTSSVFGCAAGVPSAQAIVISTTPKSATMDFVFIVVLS